MSKISALPVLAAPTGAERVPAVQNGRTYQANIGALVQPQVVLASQYAEAAAAFAHRFPTFEAGVAGTAVGEDFSVVDFVRGWILIFRNGTSPDVDHPLIRLAGDVAYAGSGGANLIGFGDRPVSYTLERSLAWYGVDPFSADDQTAELNVAFARAKADGCKRLIGHPLATYHYNGPLAMDGIILDARGATFQRDNPANTAWKITGDRAGLIDITVSCPGAMHGDPASYGRGVGDASLYYGLWFSGVTNGCLDRVRVVGGSGAGVLMFACDGMTCGTLEVTDTEADACHMTYGTRNVVIFYLFCRNNGDDQLVGCGYRGEPWVQNIHVLTARLLDGSARGLAVLGTRNFKIGKLQIERSAGAAIYAASDVNIENPNVNTSGVFDLYIVQAELVDCVQLRQGYAICHIDGKAGSTTVDGEDHTNAVTNVVIDQLLVRGAGPQAFAAIFQSQYSSGIDIKIKIYDLRGPQMPQIARMAGGDSTLEVIAERFGGDGIIWTATATGLHRVRHSRLSDGVKDGITPYKALLGWETAATAATYDLEDVELLGGGTAGVASLGGATPTPGSLRMVHVRRDGKQVRHVDPIAEQWTYDGGVFTVALTDFDEPAPMRQTIPQGGKLRISFSPPFRLVLDLLAVSASDQSQSVRLVESLTYVYGQPAGVAGVDYVQISPDNGGQYVARSRTGPGEGLAGTAGLIPSSLAFDGSNVWLDIAPPGALDVRLALEVTRKTQ